MTSDRRCFLGSSLGAFLFSATSGSAPSAARPQEGLSPETLPRALFPSPVMIDRIDGLKHRGVGFIRVFSKDGDFGVAAMNNHFFDGLSLLRRLVVPFFIGKDARDVDQLVDGVYSHDINYKFVGMPFWNAVGHVELCLLDLLGRIAGRSVGSLFGRERRAEIEIYVSRFNRETSAREEIDSAKAALQRTGAGAIKLKIGLRLENSPEQTRRDLQMVELAQRELPGVDLYVDANGSYRVAEAIAMGRALQDKGVQMLEEPCLWEEYEGTKQVADALSLDLAGGEQDTSLTRFRWMTEQRAVDVLQPDVYYCGGLLRALRLARLADAAGLRITPHSPRAGYEAVPALHLAALAPNFGPRLEYVETSSGGIRAGKIEVPKGPGLGFDIDPNDLRKARAR